MNERRYLARSWALLTQRKGWIKPVLVLTAASYVPIAGHIGVLGYALEWARLTAWGVDAAPKQRKVDIGACLISGARALIVGILFGLAVGVPVGVLRAIASSFDDGFGLFLGLAITIVTFAITLLASTFVMVAQLRVAIYEKIGAGFSVSNIMEMISRDKSGFLHLVILGLLQSALAVTAFVLVFFVVGVIMVPLFIAAASASEVEILRLLAGVSIPVALACVPLGFALSLLSTLFSLLLHNATALWMRQFNVPAWGGPDDPLPQATT